MTVKRIIFFVVLGVLSAQAGFAQATNEIRLAPTNNIIAAHGPYQGDNIWRVAPNTMAFEKYGLYLMLAQANDMREKWKLDISHSLTINDVLFWVKPTAYGIEGSISTRDGRFDWLFNWGVLSHFCDEKYWPRSFRYHDDESARLAKIKSKINAQQAEAIARNALHKLGLTEEQLHLIEPPRVNQYKFEETNGVVYPLPMFNVGWVVEGFTDSGTPSVTFDISGITKTVAEYFTPHTPRVPLPTNYFQMLNLPTNYLETLSPRERFRLYLPPLTNSPPQAANLLK